MGMMNVRITVVFFFLFVSATAYASETFLCIANIATGFAFDKSRKEWYSANFRTGNRYIISIAKTEGYAWEVKKVGKIDVLTFCEEDFNEEGDLVCTKGYFKFRMNKSDLRFLLSYPFGYWSENIKGINSSLPKEGDNTPYMEIGRCSLR